MPSCVLFTWLCLWCMCYCVYTCLSFLRVVHQCLPCGMTLSTQNNQSCAVGVSMPGGCLRACGWSTQVVSCERAWLPQPARLLLLVHSSSLTV